MFSYASKVRKTALKPVEGDEKKREREGVEGGREEGKGGREGEREREGEKEGKREGGREREGGRGVGEYTQHTIYTYVEA